MVPTVNIEEKQIFRTLFEGCKVMINNDARLMYGRHYKYDALDLPGRIYFSRPVFQEERLEEEISNYLQSPKLYKPHEEERYPLTAALDAFYQIAQQLELWKGIYGDEFTPDKALSNIIAQDYYDCMSGGMDKTVYQVCVMLAQLPNININTEVYPGKDGKRWLTLRDFVETYTAPKQNTALQQAFDIIQSHSPNLLA